MRLQASVLMVVVGVCVSCWTRSSGFFRDCWPLPSDAKPSDFGTFPESASSDGSVQLMNDNCMQQPESKPAMLTSAHQPPEFAQPPTIQLSKLTPPQSAQPPLMPMPPGEKLD